MVTILVLFIATYSLVVFAGMSRLLLEYSPRLKNEIPRAADISRGLSKVFDRFNIPLALITIFFCVLGIFIGIITDIGALLCSGGLVLISFIVNAISERYTTKEIHEAVVLVDCEYKASFAYIDTYNEILKLNSSIVATIANGAKQFQEQVQRTLSTFSSVNDTIDKYLGLQHDGVAGLLTVKKQCEVAYLSLAQIAHKAEESFVQFTTKLDYSAAAFDYFGEAQTLLDDMNRSFKEIFLQGHLASDAEFMKKISNLTENMHQLAFKCEAMKSFPRAYTDAINLRSAKMETALNSFEENNISKKNGIVTLCKAITKTVTDKITNLSESVGAYLELLKKKNSLKEQSDTALAGTVRSKRKRKAKETTPTLAESKKKGKGWFLAGVVIVGLVIGLISEQCEASPPTQQAAGNAQTQVTETAEEPVNSPPIPQNVRAENVGIDSMTLSWDSTGTGVLYQLYYAIANNVQQAQAFGTRITDTSTTITSLTADTIYYFWVTAINGNEESDKSTVVSVKTSTRPSDTQANPINGTSWEYVNQNDSGNRYRLTFSGSNRVIFAIYNNNGSEQLESYNGTYRLQGNNLTVETVYPSGEKITDSYTYTQSAITDKQKQSVIYKKR